MYRKLQPTPKSVSASQNWIIAWPASATPRQATMSTAPQAITMSTPKRRIRWPVKNDGAYMPSTCHWITNAAAPKPCALATIASGVTVISRIITPYETTPPSTATTNIGWRAISESGRPPRKACAEGLGMSTNAAITRTAAARPPMARKAPMNVCDATRSRDASASQGPNNAATTPPASTSEIARPRNASGATSGAAKRR